MRDIPIYKVYLDYNIQCIRLDAEGKYPMIGAGVKYINIIEDLGINTGVYTEYLMIVQCDNFNNHYFIKMLNDYKTMDNVIVIAELAVYKWDEEELYQAAEQYDFEKITIGEPFNRPKTFMILKNHLGDLLLKYLKQEVLNA